MLVETICVTEFEYYFACTRILSYESRQNDISSFIAMNVALTLSFKLISFQHLFKIAAVRVEF